MSETPDCLTLARHRDLVGRSADPWIRRALTVLVVVVVALGLANVFGQRPQTSAGQAPEGKLSVVAPSRLRSGLLYQARFHVDAYRSLRAATLVLDPGWLESMTLNTIEPAPVSESSRNGRLALDFGHLPRGDQLIVFMQFQVNPTNVGHRAQAVELADGERTLVRVHRSVTVFP